MALLSKDQILKADDLSTERLAVSEWGSEVIVHTVAASIATRSRPVSFRGRR
ncbi:hypothetical protein ACWD6P_19645 [Streptomyces sp. NPDC002446]